MAFYATGLPNVAAATTDLWPSIANTLMVPWRGSITRASSSTPAPRQSSRLSPGQKQSQLSESPATPNAARTAITETLADVDLSPILFSISTPSPLKMQRPVMDKVRRALSLASPAPASSGVAPSRIVHERLLRASLLQFHSRPNIPVKNISQSSGIARFMSTLRQPMASRTLYGVIGQQRSPFYQPLARMPAQQTRSLSTGGISTNLLANREAAANRNPTSATAQNAFYQVLLKANMPLIVIERFNSGRFATNEAATEAYHRALGMISSSPGVSAADVSGQVGAVAASNGQLTPAQLQAVGQAMAAQTRGGNIAMTKGNPGTGAKDTPIHVVVDQPIGDYLFRWVKFILWFVLFTYLSLVVVTMMIEGLNQFRRPGGGRFDSEVKPENQTTRFTDVHGCEEAKEELEELVQFLKDPTKFSTLGGKLPKGILLVGPPGTGKTLLARAVAGEAGVPFFYMSGSEFDEVYVGVGAKRIRELFTAAKAKSPAIVFIDELDAIGSRRNARDAAYVKQTLNQLLTELDGFDQNSGVIIIGATNFPESLDKALTRPGRFDRHVVVSLPDVRGRLAILKHHAKKIKAAPEIDLQAIAQGTSGLSGADLESIVNQAAVRASKTKGLSVSRKDFEWAMDKVIMGAERRSMVISPKEKEMTAYHEAGHALVKIYQKDSPSKLHKVTILPRGNSLGHTSSLPEMDRYSVTVRDFLGYIDVAMGGKLAEDIVYGSDMVTSGVSQDLQQATSIAFQMVSQFGMSEKLGPMEYSSRFKDLSSQTRSLVEDEVQSTLTQSYERTKKLLLSKRKELDLLAKALIEYETLDRNEVEKVITGQKLKDRIKVPEGSMIVPIGKKPIDAIPGLGEEGNDGDRPPPPAPPPTPAQTA